MHINQNRLTQQLSKEETVHIEECEQCRDEYNLLLQLKSSAEEIPLLSPNDANWQAIEKRIAYKTDKQPRKSSISYTLLATAASILLIAGGWLIGSNYQLQRQLDQVLLVNHDLEEKLSQLGGTQFGASLSFMQIIALEEKLKEKNSNDIKLKLLKERENMINKMVLIKKEGEYEYSI
jgi:hypothetical protein